MLQALESFDIVYSHRRKNEKCVMVIDENLPIGIIGNMAALMQVWTAWGWQGISGAWRHRNSPSSFL